jgi:hypothetical protein
MDRLLALAYSLLATTCFVVVRNSRHLEDTRFIVALLVASGCALALTLITGALRRRGTGRTALTGVGAFVLVPLLYVGYLVVFVVSVCLIGGEACYS